MRGLLGCAAILALAYALSEDRRRIPWRAVFGGLALQWGLAVAFNAVPALQALILPLDHAADALQRATDAGTAFVFGYLGGGTLPFAESHPGASFILAFKILPLVLVISALGALLLHWGVLQRITGALAWGLRRTLGIGGALALAAAVHIFVGMIEAPLLIRAYLARMQRGELFAVMTCGMAGVAGTVMVIYATILAPVVPNALGTILAASFVSTPAALAIAALMIPFGPGDEETRLIIDDPPANAMDALVRGTADGVAPLVGIATTLLVAVALVSLVNGAIAPLTLQGLAAYPFRPLMYLIGIPWRESDTAAQLMGTKTILNEFVAYLDLAAHQDLSPHTRLILTYSLCGFANLGSLGILIGGMSTMLPGRRSEVAALATRSLLSGTLATCLSGAVVSVVG